jgi:coatomer subunit beta
VHLNALFAKALLSFSTCIRSALDGECGFLAANLYAKSVFGEDALVNISVEKQADGKLTGYIRIRSKTQGIALSLGDKITLKQKGGNS